MLTIILKYQQSPSPPILKDKVPSIDPFPEGSYKRTRLESSEKEVDYFSTLSKDKKFRTFRFPKNQSIGQILIEGTPVQEAVGNVEIPVDTFFVFKPSAKYLDSTRLLKRFRVDELRGLELNDEARSTVEVFEILPSLRSLEYLKIAMDVDDAAIKYIAQLPKLNVLQVSNTQITGKAIASLQRLTKLTKLGCSGLEDLSPLIIRLPETKLLELDIESSHLTPFDMQKICQVKTLQNLGIGGNTAIDDEAIKAVQQLKNLKELYVSGCNLSNKSLTTLASLKSLKYLQVSEGMFSAAEIRDLKKVSKISIEVHGRPIE